MATSPPSLNLIVLRSADIDQAARFYTALGLQFIKHRHGSGPEHYSSIVAQIVFELYPLGKLPPTIGTRIGFSVEDVDVTVPVLVAVGAELVSPPANSEWGRRAVVKDLDGHVVELLARALRDKITGD